MKQGLNISPLTLGGAQFGMNYGIANTEGKPDEAKAFSIIRTAFENGINCVDTAADYGDSEKVIGDFFRSGNGNREEIIIVTKVRLGQISPSKTEVSIMRSFEKSAENLETGFIDILLLHDAKEYISHGREISKSFERLISEGLVGTAGASSYCFEDIRRMIDNPVFGAFQVPVNLLDSDVNVTDAARIFREKIIFARSIFLQGLFFLDPHQLRGKMKEAGVFLERIGGIARELKITINELAIRYVMSLKLADSLVIGADNPAQLKQNIELTSKGPFSEELVIHISKMLKGAPEWLIKPYMWTRMISDEATSGS